MITKIIMDTMDKRFSVSFGRNSIIIEALNEAHLYSLAKQEFCAFENSTIHLKLL